jgi:hypothetical protein
MRIGAGKVCSICLRQQTSIESFFTQNAIPFFICRSSEGLNRESVEVVVCHQCLSVCPEFSD